MDVHALDVLEYNEILKKLSEEAGSQIAKEKALALFPSDNRDVILSMLNETEEAFSLMEQEQVPIGGIRDIREALKIASFRGKLDEMTLLDVAQTLATGKSVLSFLFKRREKYPCLYEIAKTIKPLEKLQDKITSAISPKGEVYSNASPKLASLRKILGDLRNSISSKMGEMLKSSGCSKMFQEGIITTREGRFVFPVKAEYKSQFKGIVHDQSSSGVTLFMEPIVLVEKNNKLKKAYLEEKEEVERILKELSDRVADDGDIINNNLKLLTDLDLILAKGRLAFKFKAIRPFINNKKKIKIVRGRHPLLNCETVVPISVELGERFKCLVITGPNTGGKTVTLKMTGLFILMAQSGLYIPADEGSELPCFTNIYADIGDEQSIVQSLSTFSSHIKEIGKIIARADNSSLILLDELGAGTDPSEGAVLAIAILEYLLSSGSLCMVTTHHNRLKAFAATNPGAENACVDFDIETLCPIYNLTIGQPGRSQALVIAERLGIPGFIIDNARENLSGNTYEIDNLLEKIKEDSDVISEEKEAAYFIKKDLEELKRRMNLRHEKEEAERKKIVEELSLKSRNLLSSVQKEVKETRQELRKILKKRQQITSEEAMTIMENLQKKLNMEEEKIEDFVEETAPPEEIVFEPVKDIIPGDYVHVKSLGYEGYVTEIIQENEVKIQVGMMTINVKTSDLARIKAPYKEEVKEEVFIRTGSSKIMTVSPELMLISKRAEEATYMLEKYLDDAYLARHKEVRIVHGKGTGVLRNLVKDYLKNSPIISSFRLGGIGEGGAGVTIAELDMD